MRKIFPCLKAVNTACCVTLAGIVCGWIALCMCFTGHPGLFYPFFTLAALFDLADGMVARKLKQCGAMGEALDSLADVSSFVVVPAVTFCWLGGFQPLWCAAALVYLICGILRLAYFNVEHTQQEIFIGVASPWAASIMISLCLVLIDILKLPPTGALGVLMPIWCVCVALSMVLGCIRIRKSGAFSMSVVSIGGGITIWGIISALLG